MPKSSQMRLHRSVKNLIQSFIQRFEIACQPDCKALGKQLDSVWNQIRLTLDSYPSVFPPEILPEIFTKYSHTEPLIEVASREESPVLWLMEQFQPLCDYLDMPNLRRNLSYA